jgi:hypothetical protein
MREKISVLFVFLFAFLAVKQINSQGIIIDHKCISLSTIPQSAIEKAKRDLHILYAHASHGSQISKGMNGLVLWKGSLYAWRKGGGEGYLDMHDYNQKLPYSGGFVVDLGEPNTIAWVQATREYLNANPQINVVMWSWCGQVGGASVSTINGYLDSMTNLEKTYPTVKFVYMTGHLDGTGLNGRLHRNNEIIRNYCRQNNKILYDFADIESYDPDGNYYGDKFATDACNYDFNGDGVTQETIIHQGHLPIAPDRNWAIDWQEKHVRFDWVNGGANRLTADYFGYYGPVGATGVLADSLRISHSQPINMTMKTYAAWWLWARLAGWGETPVTQIPSIPTNLSAAASGTNSVTLQWAISSNGANTPSGFTVFRSINQVNYSEFSKVTTAAFRDTALVGGQQYSYRIRAFNTIGSSELSAIVTYTNPDVGNEVKVVAVTSNDSIKYFKGTSNPPQDWTSLIFDDSKWDNGRMVIGYGDAYTYGTQLTDMLNNYTSLYIRKKFASNLQVVDSIVFDVDYDDGFALFLNGVRVGSSNAPEVLTNTSMATGDHESGSNLYHLKIDKPTLAAENILAIQVLNTGLTSSDLALSVTVTIYGKLKTSNKPKMRNNTPILKKNSNDKRVFNLQGVPQKMNNGGHDRNLTPGVYISEQSNNKTRLIIKK